MDRIMKKEGDTEMMTIKEVAGMLRITRQSLHARTKDGALPSYKIGRRVLYKRSEVEQYLENQKQ